MTGGDGSFLLLLGDLPSLLPQLRQLLRDPRACGTWSGPSPIVAADGRQLGRGTRGQGLSKRTVYHQHRALNMALDEAVAEGLLVSNPAALVKPPTPEDEPMPALDGDRARHLLALVEVGPLAGPVTIALGTGLRMGEIPGLSWDAVHVKEGVLWVRRSLERVPGGVDYKPPKTKRSRRVVPLPSFVVDALVQHRAAQEQQRREWEAVGNRWQDHGLVVTMEDGRPMRPDFLSKQYARLMDAVGWPEITFHSPRRTYVSLLAQAQVNPRVALELVGHSRLEATLGPYTVVQAGMHQGAVADLESLLSPGKRT